MAQCKRFVNVKGDVLNCLISPDALSQDSGYNSHFGMQDDCVSCKTGAVFMATCSMTENRHLNSKLSPVSTPHGPTSLHSHTVTHKKCQLVNMGGEQGLSWHAPWVYICFTFSTAVAVNWLANPNFVLYYIICIHNSAV